MQDFMIGRRHVLTSSAALVALSASPALARRAVLARDNRHGWPQIQALMDAYVADGRVPGLAAAIGHGTDDAEFLFAGTIAKNSKRAVDADSLFRVYSMTKPITGMAAMMLIEDGKLGLDQPIGEILPAFKAMTVLVDPEKDLTARPATRPITVRNLLTHTAGLGYTIVTKGPLLAAYVKLGINPAALSRKAIPGVPMVTPPPSLAEFADRLATLPLIADPGTKWSYSVALDLMGRVIEVASGMPFDRFVQTRLFDPLGMTSSYFQVPDSEVARLTSNYAVIPSGLFLVDPGNASVFSDKPAFPFGGAGLVMSTRDYDRFLLMLAGLGAVGRSRVMKTETARVALSNLMPTTVTAENGFEGGQGFGAGGSVITRAVPGKSSVGTYGWGGAAQTIAWVDPVRKLRATGMAQYFNQNNANPRIKFPTAFAQAFYGVG